VRTYIIARWVGEYFCEATRNISIFVALRTHPRPCSGFPTKGWIQSGSENRKYITFGLIAVGTVVSRWP